MVAIDLRTRKTEALAATFGGALETVWGNICDPGLWSRVLSDIDTVLHLAAIIPPAADRNPSLTYAVNQTATIGLLQQMEASPIARRLIAACPQTDISFKDVDNLEVIFNTSASGRVEMVHNDDAALAFANAVSSEEAIGKILLIGGGESCRSHALPFYDRMFSTVGLGPLKPEVLRPGPPHFFGDWLDTTESQKLLAFQRHSMDDIFSDLEAKVGLKRRLLKIVAPLVNLILERRSPHRTRG